MRRPKYASKVEKKVGKISWNIVKNILRTYSKNLFRLKCFLNYIDF